MKIDNILSGIETLKLVYVNKDGEFSFTVKALY